tara:strand:- start:1036 stop:1485 length:450 start_codon:yes stop_codon:yes gene_type:complete
MLSLQELCLNTITKQIINAPPLIQDLIISTTTENIRLEIIEKLKKEQKLHHTYILQCVEFLVPEIIQEIIFVRNHNNRNIKNFYEIYSELPKECIETALEIAENVIRDNEPNFFNVLQGNPPYSWWNQESNSDEELSNIDYPDEEDMIN